MLFSFGSLMQLRVNQLDLLVPYLVSRQSPQLRKKSLVIQLGNDTAVHEVGRFFVPEKRVAKGYTLDFELHRFFSGVGLARHPAQRSVANHIEAFAVRDLHVQDDDFLD
jgi:hypothetical protein